MTIVMAMPSLTEHSPTISEVGQQSTVRTAMGPTTSPASIMERQNNRSNPRSTQETQKLQEKSRGKSHLQHSHVKNISRE